MRKIVAGRGVFVGRRDELEWVSAAFEDVRLSRPRILLIEGEPGVGKTAFVRQFLSELRDAVVLEASGDESETTLDYGVVSQLASRAPPELCWPSLGEGLSTGSPTSGFAVGGELLSMLGSVQERGPVVLVVDDAHWVDSASADALLFALRRLHADRVLVLIVSRPRALDRAGLSWSRLLNDAERVQRVELPGLNPREIDQLARSLGYEMLTAAAAERLRRHTAGNPLYVRGLLAELPPEALSSDRGPLPAPHSFAATVLARLTGVRAETQELVAAAAVAGPHIQTRLAQAAAGLADSSKALDEAVEAGLLALVPLAVPEEVTFPHPLIRAAVYDDLSPRRRRTLHLRCAGLTAGSVSLAHRVAASQGADEGLAAELRATAEAEIAVGRLPAAEQHLLWASRVAPTREGQESALLRAVECRVVAGDVPGALSRRDEVLGCADSPHRSYVLGSLTALAGQLPEAQRVLRDVIARPDFAASPELEGLVASRLAVVSNFLGHGEEGIAWARRALSARDSPRTAEMTAMQALAMGLMVVGRARESVAALESLSASRIDLDRFEAETLTARGNLKAWWGDLSSAVEDLSAVITWSRSGGPLRNLPNAYAALAQAEYYLGRWEEGITHAEVAVSLAEDADRVWDLPFVHAICAHLHAGRGNWDIAAEHVAAAGRIAELVPLPLNRYYASIGAANLAWTRGEWDAVLGAVGPLPRRRGVTPGAGQPSRWLIEAEALLCTGRIEDAARVLDQLEAALGESPQDVARVDLWRLRGVLAQAREHPAEARAAFGRGEQAAASAGSALAEAGLQLAHGQFLRKAGSRRAATRQLQAARGQLERMGAQPFLERCVAELAACGVRSQALPNGDDYGLTAREQVVAALVASGKSNREVAGELYLSTKAVEYHLAHIFTKVGIRSRHQLAGRLPGASVTARS